MKKPRFTDSQIMDAPKRVEAWVGAQEIFREMDISTATLYEWRAKSSGMDTSMMVGMEGLEIENARLREM